MEKCAEEVFSCKRGNETIYGRFYRPIGKSERLPIMIISHGFLGNYRQVAHYANSFAGCGYAVFIFDFNGGGIRSKSTGKTIDMTVFTEVEDLQAVIVYAKARKETDEKHLVLMGCSQGGFVSAITAARLKEEVERLILLYPALCIPDDARKGKMVMAKFNPQNIPDIVRCGPMKLGREYPATLLNRDAYEMIREYRGPVQIIHGTADNLVNISYSKRAHQEYENSTFTCIEGAGHGFRKKDDAVAISCVKEFLSGRREVLCVDVHVDGHKIVVKGRNVHISFPFSGSAYGDEFTGEIMPGAADEQDYIVKKEKHLCADYKVAGKDRSGSRCIIHIINRNDGEGWKPQVRTDSSVLSKWNRTDASVVMEERKHGPRVHLFL